MKKQIIALSVIILISFTYIFWISLNKTDVVYVDINKLYDGFNMKKELEVKYNKVIKIRNNEIDSLIYKLKVKADIINGSEDVKPEVIISFREEEKKLNEKKSEYDAISKNMKFDFQQKALNQLNEYLKSYGKKNKHDIILGTNGQGRILYAKDQLDITLEVMEYVNKKYNGYEI